MLAIGVTRRIDPLGRVTIPKEFRKYFQIKPEDMVEIIGTENGILIRVPNMIVTRKDEE